MMVDFCMMEIPWWHSWEWKLSVINEKNNKKTFPIYVVCYVFVIYNYMKSWNLRFGLSYAPHDHEQIVHLCFFDLMIKIQKE